MATPVTHFLWVSGWAIPAQWFADHANRLFPDVRHTVLPPGPELPAALRKTDRCDWIIGYSLGAFLLLKHAECLPEHGKTAFLAPFFAFPAEEKLGGAIRRNRVHYLARWLKKDPVAALNDFYEHAGLDELLTSDPDVDIPSLIWGLEQLANGSVKTGTAEGAFAVCAENDPLLDTPRLQALLPQIRLVPTATHSPLPLMEEFRRKAVGNRSQRSSQHPNATKSFERAAATYETHAGIQTEMAEWLAEWLPKEKSGDALELGAGTGLFTRRLLPWNGTLVPSDCSLAMILEGKKKYPDLPWRMERAQFPHGTAWDCLFSSSLLQWIEDPAQLFDSWHRCLKPGGRFLSGFYVEETLPELRSLDGFESPVRWRPPEQWVRWIEAAGFDILRSESTVRKFHHPSALALFRQLHGVGAAPTRRLSAARLRTLLQSVERESTTGKGIRSTWTFFRVEAEKPGI